MDRTKFLDLAGRYKDTVFRVALNALGNVPDADDVTQEVLIRLLEHTGTFENETHVKYWLIRVTLNQCKNILRAPWRKRNVPLDEAEATPVFDRAEQGELYATVMALPEKYRVPLYLFYYEGYSVRETAELLGIKESAVTTRLSRARQMLKTELTEVS